MYVPENAIDLIDALLEYCAEPLPRHQVEGISDIQRQQINYEATVLFLKGLDEFIAKWFGSSPGTGHRLAA